jgi:hypothetical protein
MLGEESQYSNVLEDSQKSAEAIVLANLRGRAEQLVLIRKSEGDVRMKQPIWQQNYSMRIGWKPKVN